MPYNAPVRQQVVHHRVRYVLIVRRADHKAQRLVQQHANGISRVKGLALQQKMCKHSVLHEAFLRGAGLGNQPRNVEKQLQQMPAQEARAVPSNDATRIAISTQQLERTTKQFVKSKRQPRQSAACLQQCRHAGTCPLSSRGSHPKRTWQSSVINTSAGGTCYAHQSAACLQQDVDMTVFVPNFHPTAVQQRHGALLDQRRALAALAIPQICQQPLDSHRTAGCGGRECGAELSCEHAATICAAVFAT